VNLTNTSRHSEEGFTLIEALVSLVIFVIGFSGLYLFYGMSQTTIDRSDRKLYASLLADGIVETIVAETRRPTTDVLNPFLTPASYTANLSNCATYPVSDVRYTWCMDANTLLGPMNLTSGQEARAVNVLLDGKTLIVSVNIISDSGAVQSSFSRKIRK
jgi:prepilin-type N-terminal cleavage/methylation domain-containing protein